MNSLSKTPTSKAIKNSNLPFISTMKAKASNSSKALGPYGWSLWMLQPIMKDTKPGSFIHSMATVTKHLGDAVSISRNLLTLLTIGRLLALLKAPLDSTNTRKLRPINSGVVLLRTAFQTALSLPATKSELSEMEDLQFAITNRGPERVAHYFAAKYRAKNPINVSDFKNAFNQIDRAAMIDSASPTIKPLAIRYYGGTSLVNFKDNVIYANMGVRQGCSLGSALFCQTVHPVWRGVVQAHPTLEGRALTDDFSTTTQEPPTDYSSYYSEIKGSHQTRSRLSKPLGLEAHPDKEALLLPLDAPEPQADELPPNTRVTRDGVTISGTPIGTDDFCTEALEKKEREIASFLKLLLDPELATNNPDVAMTALKNAIMQMQYLIQTVPPRLTRPIAVRLDNAVWDTFYAIATPDHRPTPATSSKARLQRARLFASLPTAFNGYGLSPLRDLASSAYLASAVHSAAIDPALYDLFCAADTQDLSDALADCRTQRDLYPPTYNHGLALLPPASTSTTNRQVLDYFLPLLADNPTLRLQSTISRSSNMSRYKKWLSYFLATSTEHDVLRQDIIHARELVQSNRGKGRYTGRPVQPGRHAVHRPHPLPPRPHRG